MCLYVYKIGTVPSGIEVVTNNDLYFKGNSILLNNDECNKVLNLIDQARYRTEDTFIGREEDNIGGLSRTMLSTGTKTAINILNHPDKCFSLIECGNNARNVIFSLKNGIVEWDGFVMYNEDLCDSVDFMYEGKRFTSMEDFSAYMKERENNYD